MRNANHKNVGAQNQVFYVGFLAGQPVGSTLLVEKDGTAGIYAVATLPESRKQGVGSTLMAEAIKDANLRNCKVITLQVAQGSYAESLYINLGFKTEFTAKIFGH